MEALMQSALTPTLVVTYQNKNITADISQFLLDATYTDVLEGESDSLEISLSDTEGRWLNAWYPTHGDSISLKIGYQNAPLLACGDFEIDEISLDGAPDVVKIKALAAGVTRAVRTHKGKAYEHTNLRDIAATVAKHNKLKLLGTIEPIAITRVTQVFETDLTFLKRLAAEYGYSFSMRGANLTFFKRAALKAEATILSLARTDLATYSFRDKVHGVVAAASVNYHDPHKKLTRIVVAQDGKTTSNKTSADTLKLNIKAENDVQAKHKATAALDRANEEQTVANFSLMGNVKLVAGINVAITSFGKMDGKYQVIKSTHTFSRGNGYSTDIELKRVRA